MKAPELPEGAKSLLNERSRQRHSHLRIAHLDVANSKATFVNGLLEVRLPKAAEARKENHQHRLGSAAERQPRSEIEADDGGPPLACPRMTPPIVG